MEGKLEKEMEKKIKGGESCKRKRGTRDEEETWSGSRKWRRRGERVATGEAGCHSWRTNKPSDGISFLIGPALSGLRRPPRSAWSKQPGHFTRATPTPIGAGDNCVPPSVPPSLWICINELQGRVRTGARLAPPPLSPPASDMLGGEKDVRND